MAKPTKIYAILEPDSDQVRYVGKTVKTLRRRLGEHIGEANRRTQQNRRTNWIVHVLRQGLRPRIKLLETIPADGDWATAERRWISHYREAGHRLLNATDGGEGTPGRILTEEHKQRISASLLKVGHLLSAASKKAARMTPRKKASQARIAAMLRGRRQSPEHAAKSRAAALGRKQSAEEIAKRTEHLRGRPLSAQHREALRQAWHKKPAARLLTFNNQTRTAFDWAAVLGINYYTLMNRLNRGWSVDKALSTKSRAYARC